MITLHFPFTGHWMARNSPTRRVPSHGTWVAGTGYSVDFVGLDAAGKQAPFGLADLFRTEDPAKFPGFGREIVAPCAGVVTEALDEVEDHVARRSQFLLAGYMVGQPKRFREGGIDGLTGNRVVLRADSGENVALVHLKRGSVAVTPGQRVEVGDVVGLCGNSGNSTKGKTPGRE